MIEWAAATPTAGTVKRYRQCSPRESELSGVIAISGPTRLPVSSCEFGAFMGVACLCSYIGMASGKHMFTLRNAACQLNP